MRSKAYPRKTDALHCLLPVIELRQRLQTDKRRALQHLANIQKLHVFLLWRITGFLGAFALLTSCNFIFYQIDYEIDRQ
ncbi:MAG: hypothetical protein ABI642_01945 [Polaromonas sp.]